MVSSPLFSIILPTFNRAEYLPFAIKSILDQTFGDFELVISNNHSSDSTEDIVHGYTDSRIRYFKTEKLLSGLDNWKFALEKAQGKFITFLGDDDANSIVTFELVKEVLDQEPDCRLLGWQLCHYFWETHNEPEGKIPQNTLSFSPFSGRLLRKDAKETIKDIFSIHGLISDVETKAFHNELPSLVNAVYHRAIISEINAFKYFFHPNCYANDRYNAVIAVKQAKQFFYLDYPLHLHGFSPKSGTATVENARMSFRKSSEEMLIPFECLTHRNYAANAILHAKRDLGDQLEYIKIDWLLFFKETFKDLMLLQKKRICIDDDLQSFYKALSEQPNSFQTAFYESLPSNLQTGFDNLIYQTKNIFRPTYKALNLNRMFRKILQKSGRPYNIQLKGNEENFLNILECAHKIDKDWLESYKI